MLSMQPEADRASLVTRMRATALTIAGARTLIGGAAIVAPRLVLKMFGFRRSQHSQAAVLVMRLFGVREVALGVLVVGAANIDPCRPNLYALNAGVDGGDALLMAAALQGRGRGERPVPSSLLLAIPVTASWLWLRQKSLELMATRAGAGDA